MDETGTNENIEITENYEEQVQEEQVQEEQVQEEVLQPSEYNQIYSEQLELTNHILTGEVFFLGLIFGVLLFQIFWSRWKI